MPNIYHQVPASMKGTRLFPLNQLRELHPDIYRTAVTKYDDHPSRKAIPVREIHEMGCTWSDVVQFSPVHPRCIALAMKAAGMSIPECEFLVVPIKRVTNLSAVWYFGMDHNPCYERIEWEYFQELDSVPEKTMQWYGELAHRSKTGAVFNGLPHVMVKGAIDVEGCATISLNP